MKLILSLLTCLPCAAAVLQFDVAPQTSPCVWNIYVAPLGSTNWVKVASITETSWNFGCTNAMQIRVTTQLHDPRHVIKEREPESVPRETIIVEPFCWRRLD